MNELCYIISMSEKLPGKVISFEEFQARRKQKNGGPEASLKDRFDASAGQPTSHVTQEKEVPPHAPMSEADFVMEEEFNNAVISALPSSTLRGQGRAQARLRVLASEKWDKWKTLSTSDRALAIEFFIQTRLDEMGGAKSLEDR
jgi:hypothetical protein